MPGVNGEGVETELNGDSFSLLKEKLASNRSPRSPLSPGSPHSEALDLHLNNAINTSIEQLYENVCEMQSSDQSPSRFSYGSDGDESRIDSELCHLVGGEIREVEIMQDEKKSEDAGSDSVSKKENDSVEKKSDKIYNIQSTSPKSASSIKSKMKSGVSTKSSRKNKKSNGRPPIDKHGNGYSPKPNGGVVSSKKQRNSLLGGSKLQKGAEDPSEAGSENLELGPFLLKQARDLISGDNPHKALDFALRAATSFEKYANGKPSLDLVMSLHVIAAIHCSLGQYDRAIPVLEHSIEIPVMEEGHNHALAKFAGLMQLGDTYAMVGQLENSIMSYTTGLEIQKQVLGELDPRVGETCWYLSEAHVQALQFDEAEKLCQMALDIHRQNGQLASLEEAADRRLMGLICETKGDHEAALEHLVLASMAMVANGQEAEVASVDCSIGDTYLSLARYDEAIFSYQKALTMFKSTKGENHPAVASVFVRLADLSNKIGKVRESKSYCENALRIYGKPIPGIPVEEIASGLTDISAIYESLNEPEQALQLLQKALKMYADAPGQQSTVAGIEAQMGVLYYMLGNYSESYTSLMNAVTKLRASGEKKSTFFGIALNQMGLACVQRYAINEAADLFEEARSILEQEYGPYHPDTLGVYSNLAGTYDAMGRLDDAIEILEYVVGMREEKLGTANPDVDDEKRRLAELLKEAGRVRSRKGKSLETLLETNSHPINKNGIMV
ncbi:protein KINESIN LIGHT CHAIN-RELATED 3-like [Telopea speciosissima]|uniref:protein KINESIN LIGHT CHAIN-RELATED 3-like n=1 Tax=Telopea speciosissima TaxID=54955 RepID=UPI001CC6A549|nr:protein KINESIN LIGHT CHAIN-RELATED 3-like [Telopea speciosissima]XP_043706017.1 protein KINESIN LIGHT CHAIN-RELATED 3-like [Telopea speciosissima]